MLRWRDALPALRLGAAGGTRTLGELAVRLGRLALWLAVAVVLIRGFGEVTGGERATTAGRAQRAAPAPMWPDDAARALAVEFTTAYLSHAPGEDPGAYTRRLAALVSTPVAGELAPSLPSRGLGQTVRSATVAATARVDARHALVTVAATIAAKRDVRTRRLVVPIARDRAGGVVVYDLPSFAPAPARAVVGPVQGEPLTGPDRAAIADVLGRFLRAYLAGDSGALAYLVPPGTRPSAAGGLQLVELGSVVAAGPARASERAVLVGVQARDARSGASYRLRYRVRLVRRDRWYVADVNGRGTGSGLR